MDIAITELRPSSANGRSKSNSASGIRSSRARMVRSPFSSSLSTFSAGSLRPCTTCAEETRSASDVDSADGRHRSHHRLSDVVARDVLPGSERFVRDDRPRAQPFKFLQDDLRVRGEPEPLPGHPVQTDGVAALPVTRSGQAVEIRICRRVGALPRDTEHRARPRRSGRGSRGCPAGRPRATPGHRRFSATWCAEDGYPQSRSGVGLR